MATQSTCALSLCGAVAITFGLGSCGKTDAGGTVVEQLAREFACAERPGLLVTVDSVLSKRDECVLVEAGLDAFDRLPDVENLPSSRDLASVDSVMISVMSITDDDTGVQEDWWVVTFRIPSNSRDVDVWINRVTGEIRARPIHKPLDSSPEIDL